jgi:hypothetical protein
MVGFCKSFLSDPMPGCPFFGHSEAPRKGMGNQGPNPGFGHFRARALGYEFWGYKPYDLKSYLEIEGRESTESRIHERAT